MNKSRPYLRTFVFGAIWFGAVGLKMVSQHPGPWSTYPTRNFAVLVVAWIITASLLGVLATRFEKLRSWWIIGLATVAGSLLVLGMMLLVAEGMPRSSASLRFHSTEEMMKYLAAEAVQMADQNYGVKLDYSPESIKKADEVLGRIHEEYLRTKPSEGLRGLAMAYGAYIGEVIRRSEPGVRWERSDAFGGENSYPLIWHGGSSYVCAWCYRRITNGDEDNVWLKYVAIKERTSKEARGDPEGGANGSQPIRSATNSTPSAGGPVRSP